MAIVIKNLRNCKPTEAWDFRVDRGTVVGNPFYMKDESKRDEVCDKYEEYFEKQRVENVDFLAYLTKLVLTYAAYGKLNLFCWCAPKRCHAETIKKYVERKVKDYV